MVNLLRKLITLIYEFFKRRDITIDYVPPAYVPPPPQEVVPPPSKLIPFVDAIVTYENMKKNYPLNNNPGALRYTSYIASLGSIGVMRGYAAFKTYQDGYNALKQFVLDASQDKLKYYHNCTVRTFFDAYAPQNDNNNPDKYALYVANKCSVDVNTLLKNII